MIEHYFTTAPTLYHQLLKIITLVYIYKYKRNSKINGNKIRRKKKATP